MKYVVIGAGGTGGAIGGFLTKAGKAVTLIARGAHLKKMLENGLCFETTDGSFSVPVKACTMDDYQETPDIVFVCVKGYSLEDTIPFIERISGPDTIVIPILNIYGTGGRLQEKLPEIPVTDGCIYISAEIKEPGTILMSGKIFRVVYGLRKGTPAAIGAAYDLPASAAQAPGEIQDMFLAMVNEIKSLSDAIDASLPENIAEVNMNILNGLAPTATASMHRDIRAGKQSELDGLVYEVVRMGERHGVPVPTYEKIAKIFRDRM